MAHQSFSQEVLGMLKDVCREGGKAEAGEMSSRLCLKTRKEHKRMLNTLSDLARQGRIVRVSQVSMPRRNPQPSRISAKSCGGCSRCGAG